MSPTKPKLSDIESKLSMLSPEQIYALMKGVVVNNRVHTIDYSHKLRRIRMNDLYFNSAIKPHQVSSFEEYNMHDEGIRQQAISGVDL